MSENTNNSPERLLRRVEAAKYVVETYNVPCSPKTLAKLACVSSDGPPFRLAGRFHFIRSPDLTLGPRRRLGRWSDRRLKSVASLNPQTKTRLHDHILADQFVRTGF